MKQAFRVIGVFGSILILILIVTSCKPKDQFNQKADPELGSIGSKIDPIEKTSSRNIPTDESSVEAFSKDDPNPYPSSGDMDSVKPLLQNEAEHTPTPNIPHVSKEEMNFPILYYHAISDETWGIEELFVSPTRFEEQMKYLSENNYDVITFKNLNDIQPYKKPVILTFDDGYENNYTEAYPILKKYGFKAVIFLTTQYLNQTHYLKDWQVREMGDLIDFESHTLSHPDLTSISFEALQTELLDSQKIIENLTGQKPLAFAYPFGIFNKNVIDSVKKIYDYATTIDSGLTNIKDDPYTIKRVYVPRNTTLQSFQIRLENGFIR